MTSVASASRPPLGMLFAPLLLGAALYWFVPAHAQEVPQSQEQQLQLLYKDLLTDPTDMDKTLAYAQLATDMQDYEAAIPPLERILLTNPNAAKVKLELGILYYLLESHDVARTYFEEVVQQADAQKAYREQAETYLSRI